MALRSCDICSSASPCPHPRLAAGASRVSTCLAASTRYAQQAGDPPLSLASVQPNRSPAPTARQQRLSAVAIAAATQVPKELRDEAELQATLKAFLQDRQPLTLELVDRLEALRSALELSEWFRTHEIVGSSLLITYDMATPAHAPPAVWMIDFANVSEVDASVTLTHRTPWEKGNREEGYLLGLDNLIDSFRGLQFAGQAPG